MPVVVLKRHKRFQRAGGDGRQGSLQRDFTEAGSFQQVRVADPLRADTSLNSPHRGGPLSRYVRRADNRAAVDRHKAKAVNDVSERPAKIAIRHKAVHKIREPSHRDELTAERLLLELLNHRRD
jgi:hypothetical protein